MPLVVVLSAFLLAAGCGDDAPPGNATNRAAAMRAPEHARWAAVENARRERFGPFSVSDGGGRARIVRVTGPGLLTAPDSSRRQPARLSAGGLATIELLFEVGEHGIAEGGWIDFEGSRFWGWSSPQAEDPKAAGFTTVRWQGRGAGPPLQVRTLSSKRVRIAAPPRGLAAGDALRIVYGAGPEAARVDLYAERRSRLIFTVDGDGDGVPRRLPDPPWVEIVAGAPSALLAFLPTIARPQAEVELAIAFVDQFRNAVLNPPGELELVAHPAVPGFPRRLVLSQNGALRVRFRVPDAGVVRVRAHWGALTAESNPLLISAELPRVVWGDLHGHSAYSDGTGESDDYFRYARDTSALDVVSLTDHDHHGPIPLYQHPEHWQEILREGARHHEPGRFVTLPGFEWTHWIYGHRHVVYFADEGPLLAWSDPRYDTPDRLWSALRGRPALTFAHHSAGGPIPTDWRYEPDPELEPVTEIVSSLGASEAQDAPRLVDRSRPGRYVRDVVADGFRLGFIGSGDRHDGHPGSVFGSPPRGGLAAIMAEELNRSSLLEALRERRVYATNGPRIGLWATLAGRPAGAVVRAGAGPQRLRLRVVAVRELESAQLVRGREIALHIDLSGRRSVDLRRSLSDLLPGEVLYWRVLQKDGGAAWSSPFFVE